MFRGFCRMWDIHHLANFYWEHWAANSLKKPLDWSGDCRCSDHSNLVSKCENWDRWKLLLDFSSVIKPLKRLQFKTLWDYRHAAWQKLSQQPVTLKTLIGWVSDPNRIHTEGSDCDQRRLERMFLEQGLSTCSDRWCWPLQTFSALIFLAPLALCLTTQDWSSDSPCEYRWAVPGHVWVLQNLLENQPLPSILLAVVRCDVLILDVFTHSNSIHSIFLASGHRRKDKEHTWLALQQRAVFPWNFSHFLAAHTLGLCTYSALSLLTHSPA